MRAFPMHVCGAALALLLRGGLAGAQEPVPAAPVPSTPPVMVPTTTVPQAPPNRPAEVQLQLNVVLTKLSADKKVSNVPYMLSVVANGGLTSVRMGSRVPVATAIGGAPVKTISYTDVGLNIDAKAWSSSAPGQFKVDLTVEDSSVLDTPGAGGDPDHPVFRSFRASESLLMRDGQTTEFTAATDKLTGEVTKITVAMTVVK